MSYVFVLFARTDWCGAGISGKASATGMASQQLQIIRWVVCQVSQRSIQYQPGGKIHNLVPNPTQSIQWNTKKYMSQCIDGSYLTISFDKITPTEDSPPPWYQHQSWMNFDLFPPNTNSKVEWTLTFFYPDTSSKVEWTLTFFTLIPTSKLNEPWPPPPHTNVKVEWALTFFYPDTNSKVEWTLTSPPPPIPMSKLKLWPLFTLIPTAKLNEPWPSPPPHTNVKVEWTLTSPPPPYQHQSWISFDLFLPWYQQHSWTNLDLILPWYQQHSWMNLDLFFYQLEWTLIPTAKLNEPWPYFTLIPTAKLNEPWPYFTLIPTAKLNEPWPYFTLIPTAKLNEPWPYFTLIPTSKLNEPWPFFTPMPTAKLNEPWPYFTLIPAAQLNEPWPFFFTLIPTAKLNEPWPFTTGPKLLHVNLLSHMMTWKKLIFHDQNPEV